ncbi:MAG: peptidoglycan-binding protein [Candidatus Peribacteraceae bacterium]|nr:peptidoglycan-binding protein [Candidatus Peribacteraceae bacterium]
MQKLKQKLLAVFSLLALLATFAPVTFAATDFEPYEATFVISAYYSPLPNQRVYFRGTYEADVRLNGNGTNGADGTQVYPGMLAAPKTYPFGMKIAIPGFGVGAIHDRGGAIVQAGERAIATHDRLDVWMGKGEEGLARALQWGVRTVTCKVYPSTHMIAETFTLPSVGNVFVADLQVGDSGDEVLRLQNELKIYGYFRDPVDGFFDESTAKAVLGYQLARRIVASADVFGAGVLGPATRESLNAEIFQRSWTPPNSLLIATANAASGVSLPAASTAAAKSSSSAAAKFSTTLSAGDSGELVREMQIALTKAGFYECEINGIYDEKMQECIFNFQTENAIVASAEEPGAGVFGEQTRAKLAELIDARSAEFADLIAEKIPSKTANPGDSGETVAKLQTGLKDLGLYAGEISGEYDDATRLALIDFQIQNGVLVSATSYGAGFFGPKTLTAFQKALPENLLAAATLPENPEWARPVWIAYTPSFADSLELGDSGEAVVELQKVLQKLGYSDLEASGEFDEATELAVLDFQIKSEVLTSADDAGAGIFGPKTRAALNDLIDEQQIALEKKEEATA